MGRASRRRAGLLGAATLLLLLVAGMLLVTSALSLLARPQGSGGQHGGVFRTLRASLPPPSPAVGGQSRALPFGRARRSEPAPSQEAAMGAVSRLEQQRDSPGTEVLVPSAAAGAARGDIKGETQHEQQPREATGRQHSAEAEDGVHPRVAAPAMAAPLYRGPEQQQLKQEPVVWTEEVVCEVSLELNKVALMFLTTGPLPFEQLWEEWLGQLAGALPLSALAAPGALCLRRCNQGRGGCTHKCGPAAACHPLCRAQLAARFSPAANETALGRQQLFTVYTHAPPSWKAYPPGSMFNGTLLKKRVLTRWGAHSLMVAERRLLAAALADPANAWFVLVSETTAPLYPPQLLWQQLAHETRSKINACWSEGMPDMRGGGGLAEGGMMEDRFSRFMETRTFKAHHWRKSGQWFMLTRRHAEAVLSDREVHVSFFRHCRTGYDRLLRRERSCISDEHLIPSLLASLGEDNNTTCDWGGGTYVDWRAGGFHPRTFGQSDIEQGLLTAMRGDPGGCKAGPALEAAARSFVRVQELAAAGEGACRRALEVQGGDPYAAAALGEQCPMLARKFAPDSAPALLRLLHDCRQDLGVLPCLSMLQDSQPPATAAAIAAEGAAAAATPAAAAGAAAGTGTNAVETSVAANPAAAALPAANPAAAAAAAAAAANLEAAEAGAAAADILAAAH